MANLTFYYSTMNAGKTIDVIKTAFNYEIEGMPIIIFTSAIDTRSGSNKIKSRMGMEKDAISVYTDDDLYQKEDQGCHQKVFPDVVTQSGMEQLLCPVFFHGFDVF